MPPATGSYEQGSDTRIDFIFDHCTRALKMKMEKWQKMWNTEEFRLLVVEFFEKEGNMMLLMTMNLGGVLIPSTNFPSNPKTKLSYFIKKAPASYIAKDDSTFQENILYGDLSPNPLDSIVTFIENVINPIVNAEVNQNKWPETVVADLKNHTQEILGVLYSVQGQLKGKTLLPMPLSMEAVEENEQRVTEGEPSDVDLQVKTQIETLVIKWGKQINEVLKQDSSKALQTGFPTPITELMFWEDRVQDLQCIHDQINEERVRKMATILEKTGSTYWPALKATIRRVVASLTEAQDILVHLKPFKKHLELVSGAVYEDVERYLRPMMHNICLMWAHSKYYCTPPRIIVLLQEICNLLIELTRNYLGGNSIFQSDPEEGVVRAAFAVKTLDYFRELYDGCRDVLPVYFPETSDPKNWDFLPHLVFKRYDKFLKRMHQMKEFFDVSDEYYKLERCDIGGPKGRELSASIQALFEDYMTFYQRFAGMQYDPTDPEDDSYDEDEILMRDKIADMDQQLATLLCDAMDDALNHSPESVYKLILVIGNVLLDRPVIKAQFDTRYPLYVKMLEDGFDRVKREYDEFNDFPVDERPMINDFLPPHSASIQFLQSFLELTKENIEQFKFLELPIESGDDAQRMIRKYDELTTILSKKKDETNEDWQNKMKKEASNYINENIIEREDASTIRIQYSNELSKLLRDVKFMMDNGYGDIPSTAASIYEKKSSIMRNLVELDRIALKYNKVNRTSNQFEAMLIEHQLDTIDMLLKEGENKLKWADHERIWELIQKLTGPVDELELKIRESHDNVEAFKKLVVGWITTPLFERHDGQKDELLDVDEQASLRKEKRYNEIKEVSDKIKALVARNRELLFDTTANADSELRAWKEYLGYLDSFVVDGLIRTLATSYNYLLDHMDPNLTPSPLFEIQMELGDNEVIFTPSLDFTQSGSFTSVLEKIFTDICHQAVIMERIKPGSGKDYNAEMEANDDLSDSRAEIEDRVQAVISQGYEYVARFDPYTYLWEEDREEYLQQFLKYGHSLTPEELESKAMGEEPPINKPRLEEFKEVIDKFENLYLDIEKFEKVVVFDKWLRFDMTYFRQAVLTLAKKWSLMFKQYMIDSVIGGLADLEGFIEDAEKGMSQPLREGDLTSLISVIGFLQKVREMQYKTDNMFEPIKEYIEILKSYDYEMPEQVFIQLEELPRKWDNLKRLAQNVRQKVAPLQAQEVSKIRKSISDFDARQANFREAFKISDFLFANCPFAYKSIDGANGAIRRFENEYIEICKVAALFEVHVPEPKGVRQCRKELKIAKQICDYRIIVNSCIEEWKKTPWLGINVDNMDTECKRMAKDLKAMDKDCKQWDIFISLEGIIRNMLSSLKSVTELQNPAIRERHWLELMEATKVKFVIDEKTTLADLLVLNLHNFEEDVKNIVDKSVKEGSMEKTIRELEVTWAAQEYEFEPHPRTGVNLIKASEELIEILEDNQVQLQNIAMSKYVGFFKDEVEFWQNRLFQADQVLSSLNEVQRAWSHLESIFIATEDIRRNLPEDSKRFDKIDVEFKAVLEKLYKSKNVIEATNQPGVLGELERLQSELAICEKALADYLETKRLAFPRFYFVSSADLLDILSNGNEPSIVARHLSKLFDAMAKLEFTKEGSKIANGMIAKDGEEVKMKAECSCEGAVEIWLSRLEDYMKDSVRWYFDKGVSTYEDKPREQWLQNYPAQSALCGTQMFWSSEVTFAFGKLEEGYENALKDYLRKQIAQLSALITILLGQLSAQERQKIMTICTIDVHSRDVVQKLILMKIESALSFQWQCQLRHRWDAAMGDCFINICDAQFKYWYEYLGNTPRLVVTPLTDRCYITLTQSLHLILGGAPAGPAGTGKTETTKDLGRAMGMMVYVFNCSEQMDYRSIGNIYKGLAQTGAWGCFDEFNRISVEVLSVVAVQVKCILDAIRYKKERFNFMGEEIRLTPTVGMWITMNPGYAGRAELPENLKALFRPCAMVVPDFELIAEIMLVAEGFQEARILARKFLTLYTLCKELLSKQDHYDWGLRAIKSVLVVAGSLKRSDPDRPEDQVLMRALRDFNLPKIVSDDTPVFMGLIGDLFPALDVPRKRDLDFEKSIKIAAIQLKLQPEDNFVLKVVQLQEIIDVRHSIFILGNAGTGKSQVWRCLFRTHQNMKRKPIYNDVNPKAITNDELFGVINPATREWKDGILSVLIRDQAALTGEGPKWVILDGDIDPMWIESLNTVMDDNKVLTLASNERIALTKHMRLIFEIYTLRVATPATVSRAGILYLNPQDLGWTPYVTSWIERRENSAEKALLMSLFEKYVPTVIEASKNRFHKITPIPDIAHVELLCNLLDCILVPEVIPYDSPKEWYEIYFVFACIWAYGSATFQDQRMDHREDFSQWFTSEFKTVKFPQAGTVFDYYIDGESKGFLPWSDLVAEFVLDPELPLQATLVHTAETTRVKYFLDILMAKQKPVMLVGTAGTGKTALIGAKLSRLPVEAFAIANVPFNFYTNSEMLQRVLEKPLEKKAGRNYGPQGNKRLIYFIDDLNMPMVDEYGTVQPHTLIRQHMDYNHWYDRIKITLKEINRVQYVACMNPTAGSFTINPRLQRHFAVFSVGFPGQDALQHIYTSIWSQHLGSTLHLFPQEVQNMASSIVNVALLLHQRVAVSFLPTAIKFHYIFNLRDLSSIFQGLLFSTFDCLQNSIDVVRLWMHEATRVYRDKLIDETDQATFSKIMAEVVKKGFEDMEEAKVMATPLMYSHFAFGLGDPKYMPITKFSSIQNLLVDALNAYNDFCSIMNLVLFDDAVRYIIQISRIIESPRGNALLVGVGGSGKQSLARLAAYLSGLDVFQVALRKGYGVNDLKTDLSILYLKAGQKNLGTMYLMTDAQVAEERFLVLINDLLASGEIPDILPDDEVENIIANMRAEVKAAGIDDTRENCWKFFIERVRKVLKCVLCFSPVGNTLRNRSRKFPAIVNCTQIIWFHEWPKEALMSVSERFVKEISVLPEELHDQIANFMAFVHSSVSDMSKTYLANEKRYNYTTPKSFLEQIALYGKLCTETTKTALAKADRLESGLYKLESCAAQVDKLKKVLAVQEVVLKEKNDKADQLIDIVQRETNTVTTEKSNAAVEEKKVAVVAEEVTKIKEICRVELAKAEPALQAAYAALNTLNKANLTELKTFTSPPADVADVISAVYIMWEGCRTGKIPKDRSWKACKSQMMNDAGKFLDGLINLNKENLTKPMADAILEYGAKPSFLPELIKTKSLAAAGICSYVLNVLKFNEVFQDVGPKRKALKDATDNLNHANEKLKYLKGRITELETKLAILTKDFDKAMDAKMKCQAEADRTARTIDLANRLVGGLGAEKNRWIQNVLNYRASTRTIPGDMLLVTAFVSYVGCFTKRYRQELLDKTWIPHLKRMEPPIPMSDSVDPLTSLTDDAEIAQWNNFGLPSDRMSSENASILMSSERWPLMIDPQLQGIKWIKSMYGAKLKVLRLGQKGYLDVIEKAIEEGETVLIENIMESVDPVLEPLLARNLIRKGTAIKMGDREIDYNPNFRLILQTKLANPHYKPEMQAQTTLINFTVTRDGLEDQLLAEVVKVERPDLEAQKSQLTKAQNEFKILLKKLEDNLLTKLQSAQGNFLDDTELVENLETTKRTAMDVEVKSKEGIATGAKIDAARELYRPAAIRASLLYFILNDLNLVNPIYQFSLKAFSTVFQNAVRGAPRSEEVARRIHNLIESITFAVWQYTSRGLFECDKLIFTCQMAFQIQLQKEQINPKELDFLLRFPLVPNVTSPVEFLSNTNWGAVKSLSLMDEFRNFELDIEGSVKRWKKIVDTETSEREKFPAEWKSKTGVSRLCIMRCLRPDRMTYAVQVFIEEALGVKFVRSRRIDFAKSFEETSNTTPVFFILSPGVDPLKDVEALGRKIGFTFDAKNFHSVSLGQGQEVVAETALDTAGKEGHWVILQNIHLVARWLPTLEKKLEQNWEKSHKRYRVFLSAEPAPSPESHIIPQGILESAIKITNEPPTGMMANLHRAFDNFGQDTLESCSKEMEFKAVLFSLCYFHAVVAERRKFGTQGWNRVYPFNTGDLTISVNVLYNYLEANSKVPWEDLRYLFGEIMYGGHITDDWDRKLCRTYLEEYMTQELLDGEIYYAPGFPAPPSTDYLGYHQYIDEFLPPESPVLYGLHPNTEIGVLTATSDKLFKTIFELQPRDAGATGAQTITKEEKIKQILDDIMDKLPDVFNMADIQGRAEDKTPFIVVSIQECERMNLLLSAMKKTLVELNLGLKGELTITSEMEELGNSLFMDQLPNVWIKRAYPTTFGLGSWYADMLLRCRELEVWTSDFALPSAVWLGGFFNPQSFLTAIMQVTARKQELPLDKMCLQCDVTKKFKDELTAPPKDGACIHGVFMEGARWDMATGVVAEAKLKDLYPAMPVIQLKAITQDKQDLRNMYECPVYKTRSRGPTYVWTFNLRTREKPSKWILGGVAILLQV